MSNEIECHTTPPTQKRKTWTVPGNGEASTWMTIEHRKMISQTLPHRTSCSKNYFNHYAIWEKMLSLLSRKHLNDAWLNIMAAITSKKVTDYDGMLGCLPFSGYEILAMWNQVLKWDSEQDPSAAEQQQKRNGVWTECRDMHKAQEWTTYPSLTVGKQLSAKNKSVAEKKRWQWQLAQIPTART